MWAAQRQVLSMRSRVCRALRVMPGGDVEDPVAERGDLAAGELGWSAKQISLVQQTRSTAVSTTSSQACVLVEGPAGKVPQPGGLGFADPVLDPGVLAVPQLQPGGLPGHRPGRGVGQGSR